MYLLCIFSYRTELLINSGNLEYVHKEYILGLCFSNKIEQTALTFLINKLKCDRKGRLINISTSKEIRSAYDLNLRLFGNNIVIDYQDKLFEEAEMKKLLVDLMAVIEKEDAKEVISFQLSYNSICLKKNEK